MNNHISSSERKSASPRNVPMADFPCEIPTTTTQSREWTVSSNASSSPELIRRKTFSNGRRMTNLAKSGLNPLVANVSGTGFSIRTKFACPRLRQGIQMLTNALMNAMPAATQAETGPRDSGLLDMFHASHLKKPITIQVSHKKKSPGATGL